MEISYKVAVTDPLVESVKKGINDLGIEVPQEIRMIQKYLFRGSLSRDEVERLCRELLANPVIQDYEIFPLK